MIDVTRSDTSVSTSLLDSAIPNPPTRNTDLHSNCKVPGIATTNEHIMKMCGHIVIISIQNIGCKNSALELSTIAILWRALIID